MSQHLKDKILNCEVAPPKGIWDSIAFELDKADNTLTVAEKLDNYEVIPPTLVWSKIEESLNKEDNNSLSVAEKLSAFEMAPPASVWSKIENTLDNDDTKIVELKPQAKVLNFYKLAAAASVLLIITSAVWVFTNNKSAELHNQIASTNNKTANTSSETTNSTNSTLLTTDTQEKNTKSDNSTARVQKEKVLPASQNDELVGTNPTNDLAVNPFDKSAEKLVAKNGDVLENIDLVNTPNTYVTIVGPNGESIRVSSKFSKQLGLFTEKDPDKMENIDFIIKESALWRNKIATWRKKMNLVDVSPSMHNFMDIIELSKKVDNDKIK